jgi:hypothetical protein
MKVVFVTITRAGSPQSGEVRNSLTARRYKHVMRQVPVLIGALAVGLVGGFVLRDNSFVEATPEAVAQDWKPRNTIMREPVMSADDLDSLQPSVQAFAARPIARQSAGTGSSWSYRNCREARAAGAAPIYRGQPGYGPHMDGDSDGIACEPNPR